MKKTTTFANQTVVSALNKYYDFISPTYGPVGKSVLIDEGHIVKAVDDGKMASQAFELPDELEQAVIKYVRQAADETDERVGDGTTTAVVLLVIRAISHSQEISPRRHVYSKRHSLRRLQRFVRTQRK
jgi:chaperonin GroEL (HSP60 family)